MNEKYLTMLLLSLISISLITIIPITAQVNQPQELSRDGNVTSTIKPQGTSIDNTN